jgi:uncharacterized protein (TIGR02271 family)
VTSESGSGDVTQTDGGNGRGSIGNGRGSIGNGRGSKRTAKKTAAEVLVDEEVLDDEAVIRLAAETLNVGKRVVETGRVRVRRTTTERTQKVNIPLASEIVEIRRVPIGKQVKKAPRVRETADEIIIPVVEEVVFFERRLVLKEELHVRKVRSVEKHVEEVTVRVQEATVDRVAPQSSDDGPRPAARAERPSSRRRPANQQPK